MVRLRELRESYRLSQQRLAEQVGLTQQKVHAYETGVNEPDIYTLKLLADYFDTSVDYLVGHTDIRRKLETTAPYELSEEEAEFIARFRNLPPHLRNSLRIFMKTLAGEESEP